MKRFIEQEGTVVDKLIGLMWTKDASLDMGRHSPALPAISPFEDVQEYYWASTTSKYDNRYAWVLYLIMRSIIKNNFPNER